MRKLDFETLIKDEIEAIKIYKEVYKLTGNPIYSEIAEDEKRHRDILIKMRNDRLKKASESITN